MNKVMLIGNVGQDPDVRYFEQDQAVAQVRFATTERGYTLQNGTQVPDRTHKGDKLYIEGRIRYRMYDTQKGERRYVTEIHVDNMEMLSPKPQSAESDVVSEQAPQPQANDNQMPF